MVSLEQHQLEIQANLERWNSKPLLRKIYRNFHEKIAAQINPSLEGITIELGSGIGNIKEVIPDCLRTDIFQHPWIDQVEDAYNLSFSDCSVSNLILFDVFHHLRYPGTAVEEFNRVLVPGGRIIIFEPCMSLLGLLVYGVAHHEPIAIRDQIKWFAPASWNSKQDSYYAAQGNAYRIFYGEDCQKLEDKWQVKLRQRLSAISYVASGGYSQKQFYPDSLYPMMKFFDGASDFLPLIFATRLLVVLEKKR